MKNFTLRGTFRYGFKGSKARESEYPVKKTEIQADSAVQAIAIALKQFEEKSANKGRHTNLRFDGGVYEMEGGKIISRFQS